MINAIAIDDEPMPLKILSRFSEQVEQLKLIRTFTSTVAAKEWLNQRTADLLFLDINMPAESGLDFFRSLKNPFMVIFTTAHAEYAVDGFNLNAVDYLLKPYSFERFSQAIHKAIEYHQFLKKDNTKDIFIKSDYSVIKVSISEILYVEAYTDYLKIYRKNKKMVLTRMTMSSMMDLLPDEFIRVHRSYIIAKNRIDKMVNHRFYVGDIEVPIGKTYYKKLQNLFDHGE